MLAAYTVEEEVEGNISISKRRKTIPQRAISNQDIQQLSSEEKWLDGIISLDVFSIYEKNPCELLLKSSASSTSLSSQQSADSQTQQATSSSTSSSSNSTAAPSPLISSGVIDMSQFKNTQGAPYVIWKKGGVLTISPEEINYDQLTTEELKLASILRLVPSQYLHIKETIMTQVHLRGPFKKRDAKSWFRIDVNKTAILFDWFRALGWIPSGGDWE